MNEEPLVSIIIPTFNRAECVGDAIQSAINQSYPNKEIFVVDDGSVDNTPSIVSKFQEVKYLYKPNGGQASARNWGLKHSSGKYITSLDSDDTWKENFLRECIQFIEKEQLDFVFTNWHQQETDGNFINFFSIFRQIQPYIPSNNNSWVFLDFKDLRNLYTSGCPSPSSSLVLKSSLLKNGWNEEMNIGDDWCMLLDIVLSGKRKAAFTNQCLWYKHIGYDNLVNGRDKEEIFKLLWGADLRRLIERNENRLTTYEFKLLKKRYIKGLIITSYLSLIRGAKFRESTKFIKNAFLENPSYFGSVMHRLISNFLKTKAKRFFNLQK